MFLKKLTAFSASDYPSMLTLGIEIDEWQQLFPKVHSIAFSVSSSVLVKLLTCSQLKRQEQHWGKIEVSKPNQEALVAPALFFKWTRWHHMRPGLLFTQRSELMYVWFLTGCWNRMSYIFQPFWFIAVKTTNLLSKNTVYRNLMKTGFVRKQQFWLCFSWVFRWYVSIKLDVFWKEDESNSMEQEKAKQ